MVVPCGGSVVGIRDTFHNSKGFGTRFSTCNGKPHIVKCGEYNIVAIRHSTQENGKTWTIRGRPPLSPSSLDFGAIQTFYASLDRTVPIVHI